MLCQIQYMHHIYMIKDKINSIHKYVIIGCMKSWENPIVLLSIKFLALNNYFDYLIY